MGVADLMIGDGSQNCFFGYEAGANTKTGYGNIFFGEGSGFSNIDGSFNADTAIANIFIGSQSGFGSRSGVANVFIGNSTGMHNQGGHNTFIGKEFQEVFPEAVSRGAGQLEGEDDSLLQMDSHPALVVAIKAIQELIRENRTQQETIDQMRQELNAMKELLNNQEL